MDQSLDDVVAANHEVLARLQRRVDTLITDRNGQVVQTTLDQIDTASHAPGLASLCAMIRSAIRDIDPADDMHFCRLKTDKREILISSEDEFMLVAIQLSDKLEVEEWYLMLFCFLCLSENQQVVYK